MSTAELISPQALRSARMKRWFYPAMAGIAIAFSIAAFAPSMLSSGRRNGPLTVLLMAHGIAYLAWLLLFLIQSLLAASRKLRAHRALGTASIAVATGMAVLGYQVTIAMGRRGFDLSGDIAAQKDPLAAMGFPLLDVVMFLALFTAAYLYRRRSEIHKRLMLLTTFAALMPAPITHLTGHFAIFQGRIPFTPIIVALFLFSGAAYDFVSSRRVHPVFLWLPTAIFVFENICFVKIFPSSGWHEFARWLLR